MRFFDSFAAFIDHQYHPTFLFCAGLFASVLLCLLAMFVESLVTRRRLQNAVNSTQNYRRFRGQLVATPRHVGFDAEPIIELQDHELISDREFRVNAK